MSGFTKLKSSIIHSTIWQEAYHVRILWISMLAMKDSRGVVEGSIPGLARASGITLPECEEGLQRLLSPDPYSRTKDNEGRRIAEVDGGWLVLNHEKHRAPQQEISVARSKAGKKGAQKRWQNMAKQEELPSVNGKNSKASQKMANDRKNGDPDPDPDPEEDKNKNPPLPPQGGTRAKAKRATQMPDDWIPNEKHKELAIELGVDLKAEEAHFRDYCEANKKTYKVWDAGFRTWLRNAKGFKRSGPVERKTAQQLQHESNQRFLSEAWMKAKAKEDAEDAKRKQDN